MRKERRRLVSAASTKQSNKGAHFKIIFLIKQKFVCRSCLHLETKREKQIEDAATPIKQIFQVEKVWLKLDKFALESNEELKKVLKFY